jgi:hypothetical protein
MAHKTREAHEARRLTTVIDPLRPAVVVRRRVVETARLEEAAPSRAFSSGGATSVVAEDLGDDDGPPSSINVARALASLRADELRRVEELVSADEEAEARRVGVAAPAPSPAPAQVKPKAASEPAAPPLPPTLLIGKTIALPKLAEQMGIPAKDLTAQLVASGFYSVDAKTVLPRETARTVAQMFGWRVEDASNEEEEPSTPKSRPKKKTAAKKKAAAKRKR